MTAEQKEKHLKGLDQLIDALDCLGLASAGFEVQKQAILAAIYEAQRAVSKTVERGESARG